MNKRKRIFALALSLCMAATALPVSAATGLVVKQNGNNVEVTYEKQTAVEGWFDDTLYTFGSDGTPASEYSVENPTLDGNKVTASIPNENFYLIDENDNPIYTPGDTYTAKVQEWGAEFGDDWDAFMAGQESAGFVIGEDGKIKNATVDDEPTTDEPTTNEPTTNEPTTDEPTTNEPTDEPEQEPTDEPEQEPIYPITAAWDDYDDEDDQPAAEPDAGAFANLTEFTAAPGQSFIIVNVNGQRDGQGGVTAAPSSILTGKAIAIAKGMNIDILFVIGSPVNNPNNVTVSLDEPVQKAAKDANVGLYAYAAYDAAHAEYGTLREREFTADLKDAIAELSNVQSENNHQGIRVLNP